MLKPITRLTGLVAVLSLVAGACTASMTEEESETNLAARGAPGGGQARVVLASNALQPFDACESFLEHVISHAVDLVGPYGLEDPSFHPLARTGVEVAVAETTVPASDAVTDSFSGTNVQVTGVDEPDIVKTDGRRIVLVSEGHLIVVDITGREPVEIGRLALADLSVQSMFLEGDRVLLLGSSWGHGPIPLFEAESRIGPSVQSPTVNLVEIDISGNPETIRTMIIDGSLVSGRMLGDTVRLVLTSGPVGFEWSFPTGSGLRAEREAIERNREIVRNSRPENWIPYFVTTDADGNLIDEGVLFDCERAAHPEDFSGLNMLSVVTVDLGDGLDVTDATGVLATGSTVYASMESLYVATQAWQTRVWAATPEEEGRPDEVSTDIHKFDISTPSRAHYVASGEVRGFLLNQFAMDEHRGFLRVASTTSPNWWGTGFESESLVTVLGERDRELVEVGLVEGLGLTEQIFSVRFMGDVAYVVTFRQTDPLYTIDLSDPTSPEVVGELKILGYSAYLHPVAPGLILGVGQDATEAGRIQGTQVSLFDVSDLSDPVRVDQLTLTEGSSSQVEYDHHAFLYWEAEGLVVIPIQQWWWDEKSESVFFGAVAMRVDPDGDLIEIRRIAHPGGGADWDWRAQILRSVVAGDSLYTISAKGIMQSNLETLDEEAWLEF